MTGLEKYQYAEHLHPSGGNLRSQGNNAVTKVKMDESDVLKSCENIGDYITVFEDLVLNQALIFKQQS